MRDLLVTAKILKAEANNLLSYQLKFMDCETVM